MEAKRDENRIPTILGTSSVDGKTPVPIYADPITHRLYVDMVSFTIKSYVSFAVSPAADQVGVALTDNTIFYASLVSIPGQIICNKISVQAFTVITPGSFDFSIYSNDGQIRYLSENINVTNSGQVHSKTLSSPVLLPSGHYYFAVNLHTGSFSINFYEVFNLSINNLPGYPVLFGTKIITASTPPLTFDPVNDLTPEEESLVVPIIRLDN